MSESIYEVGDKLRYTDIVLLGVQEDLPMDAIERQAEVTEVDEDGLVYIRYGDGVEDWLNPAQVTDLFERVTWDTTM